MPTPKQSAQRPPFTSDDVAKLRKLFDDEVAKLSTEEQFTFAQFGIALGGEIKPLDPEDMRMAMAHFLNGASTVLSMLRHAQAVGVEGVNIETIDKAVQTHGKLNGFQPVTVLSHQGDLDMDNDPKAGKN